MLNDDARTLLKQAGLKVTPQRLAVLTASGNIKNHPTAEQITEFVRRNHPDIATGTVYKILETFVKKGMLKKVETDRDVMRYDAILEHHHHLYCKDSGEIIDYFDEDLSELIEDYFRKKDIPNFRVEDVKLQIIGKFNQ
jgi:Fur family transcriptional regulator, peroxide stress response regulator